MHVQLRRGNPDDASACGRICHEAFAAISSAHSFPCDFPTRDAAVATVSMMLSHPGFYPVVAEVDGEVVGSNFLDERSAVAGVGPITVAPAVQDSSLGRQLMAAVMDRAAERRALGVRLVQAAYHNRSLSLYAKLGFAVREPLACMQGPPPRRSVEGYSVRSGTAADAADCNRICTAVHGHDRSGEVADAISAGGLLVVEHDGRITGYSIGLGFFTHSVGETTDDIAALIGAAAELGGPGILVPLRNQRLFTFCLGEGLRVVQVMTLMSTGPYSEPAGGWLPSILY